MERAVGRAAQVIVLNVAPLELAHNVLRHGRLITSRDEVRRQSYYVRHAQTYFDMAYARRVFDRARQQRIDAGTFGG